MEGPPLGREGRQLEHLVEVAVVEACRPSRPRACCGTSAPPTAAGLKESTSSSMYALAGCPVASSHSRKRVIGMLVRVKRRSKMTPWRRCRARACHSRSSEAWPPGRNAPTGLCDEGQRRGAVALAVAERVEPAQRLERLARRRRRRAGRRCPRCGSAGASDDLDAALGAASSGRSRSAGSEQDRQVAAVDDVLARGARPRRPGSGSCGFSSGAPPVMSTVWASGRGRSGRQDRRRPSRGPSSRRVRSGPASTWQWRQVRLQSLPTLTWKISSGAGRERERAGRGERPRSRRVREAARSTRRAR